MLFFLVGTSPWVFDNLDLNDHRVIVQAFCPRVTGRVRFTVDGNKK